MYKEKWKVFSTRPDMISHLCNVGHEGRYCICVEYNEAIYVEGQSTTLDGHEIHHEVLQWHFGL